MGTRSQMCKYFSKSCWLGYGPWPWHSVPMLYISEEEPSVSLWPLAVVRNCFHIIKLKEWKKIKEEYVFVRERYVLGILIEAEWDFFTDECSISISHDLILSHTGTHKPTYAYTHTHAKAKTHINLWKSFSLKWTLTLSLTQIISVFFVLFLIQEKHF